MKKNKKTMYTTIESKIVELKNKESSRESKDFLQKCLENLANAFDGGK